MQIVIIACVDRNAIRGKQCKARERLVYVSPEETNLFE